MCVFCKINKWINIKGEEKTKEKMNVGDEFIEYEKVKIGSERIRKDIKSKTWRDISWEVMKENVFQKCVSG